MINNFLTIDNTQPRSKQPSFDAASARSFFMEQKIQDKQDLIRQEKIKQIQLKKVIEEIEDRKEMGIGEGRSLMLARRLGRYNKSRGNGEQAVSRAGKRNVFSPPITRNEQSSQAQSLQRSIPYTKSAPRVGLKNRLKK